MAFIETKNIQHGQPIRIYYEDFGQGRPVILIHGWPSTHLLWEYQSADLAAAGMRVISYDRRGFGLSSVPYRAYDYDSLSSDLNELIEKLDLHDVTLVGFSMGGGEVVRYLSKFGDKRIAKIVLIGAVPPCLGQKDDNPGGAPVDVFEGMLKGLKHDRAGFLAEFGKNFFGVGEPGIEVSDEFLQDFRTLAMLSSPHATQECVASFAFTDFRPDLEAIKVPAMIIHGDNDKIVPFEISGALMAKALPEAKLEVYEGAGHGLFYTHKEKLNGDLIAFIQGE
jgi:pimeloyl-ACP methyl ester carboxylesterase